jgi:peroxiredoxin
VELEQALATFREEFARTAPAGRVALYEAKIEELRSSSVLDLAIRVAAHAPDFELEDMRGSLVSLSQVLRSGPAVLTFYRGGWCPYCNIQLRAYQAILPQILALGAQLIAISPQNPDESLSTAEKNALSFSVLSDLGNGVAKRFGLVFSLPEELRAIMAANGKSLPTINGDESWELPVPATFVIDTDGTVVLAHIDVDYRRRIEPDAILDVLRSLAR